MEQLMNTADGLIYSADSYGTVKIESEDGEISLYAHYTDLKKAHDKVQKKLVKEAL